MIDDCGDRLDFDNPRVLLEVRRDDSWVPVRIACGYPDMRAAINALPIFARQQKVTAEDVRVKRLLTHSDLRVAKDAILRSGQRDSSCGTFDDLDLDDPWR